MNSWLLIRRLRGPAFLILVGVTALLNQWGVLSFSRSWPLYLILAGVTWAGRAGGSDGGPAWCLRPNPYVPAAYAPVAPYTGPTPESPASDHDPLADPSRRP